MSATERSEVRQYVVRSKTPSNSEKVLLYLRGMERIPPSVPSVDEEQDPNFVPPGSDDIPDHHPLSPRSKPSEPDRRATLDSQATHITYTDAGRPQPMNPLQADYNPEIRMPDPKHISDQSFQSWGNKGPLPNDVNRSTGGTDLGMSWGGHAVIPQTQTNQYSFSASGYPAGPTSGAASPQPIQINLTIVPPSDKSRAGSRVSGYQNEAELPEIEDDDVGDLPGPSRYESRSPVGGSTHPSRRPPSAVASQPAVEAWGDWEAVDHPGRESSHAPSGRPLIEELNAAQFRGSQSRTPVGQSRAPGGKPISNAPSTRPAPSAVRPPASHTPGSAAAGQRPAGSQFGGNRVTQMHPLSNRMPSEAPGGRPRVTSPTSHSGYQPLIFPSGGSAAPSAPPHPEAFRYQVQSPTNNDDYMNEDEEEMVNELLTRTPRTSYTVSPSILAAEVQHSHHHDEDLCVLLHAADDSAMHEIVKRAVRKAIRSRLKKLGMKGDNDAIRAYRDVHNWEFHTERPPNGKQDDQGGDQAAPPPWARQLLDALRQSQERLAIVEKKLQHSNRHEQEHEEDDVRSNATARPEGSVDERRRRLSDVSEFPRGDYGVGSPLIRGETELDATEHMTQGPPESIHHHDDSHFAPDSRRGDEDHDTMGVGLRNLGGHTPPHQDGGTRHALRDFLRSDQGSLGDQVYEQELYKLRMKPTRTGATHQTWDMTRADPGELMPEIPDSDAGFQGGDMYHEQRGTSPGPAKDDAHNWHPPGPAAWQRIHQTLLDWAVAWSPSELDKALNSTTRGNQVDSLALSVWTMQTYKRYVRLKLSENPPGNIDKMFVPPIIADVVSNAVFSGRHAEASDQLRKLWNDFGLKGSPRQIIVLAPNKRQENHWVVHRFDLSECTLNTYDTSIEKSPPDSRPLGWWFAIKAAFPNVPAPQSGHLYQNHVRMPRPLQYIIDNSVAAAAIWRNLLMSAKAERAIDLERLRDLINTEVKNLRQRKEMGKLTAAVHTFAWEQMGS